MADQYGRRLKNMTYLPRHLTLSTPNVDLKRNNFRGYIHPQSLTAVAFIFSELERGLRRKSSGEKYRQRQKKYNQKIVWFNHIICAISGL